LDFYNSHFPKGIGFSNKLLLNTRKDNTATMTAINNNIFGLFFILNIKDEAKNPKKKVMGYAHKAQELPPKGIKLEWEKPTASLAKINIRLRNKPKNKNNVFFISTT
jgi:hypothetical protein